MQKLLEIKNSIQILWGRKMRYMKAKDVDIRNYAKYLLTEGTIFEKRDLLGCLKSKIILENKLIKFY